MLGRGYATEVVTAHVPAFFQRFDELIKLIAIIYEDNVASSQVLEKCGFVLREQLALTNGAKLEHEELDPEEILLEQDTLRNLRTMLESIGLQKATHAPAAAMRRRLVVSRDRSLPSESTPACHCGDLATVVYRVATSIVPALPVAISIHRS